MAYRKKNYRRNKSGKGKQNTKKYEAVDTSAASRDVNEGREVVQDPNWYFTDATVASQVTNFSCDQFMGDPHPLANQVTELERVTMPSIMRIYVNPSVGYTDQYAERTAGINIQDLKEYAQWSAENAKTTQYAPQDIGTLKLAVGEILALFGHVRRAMGSTKIWNQRNRAFAKGIVEALGFDYDDLLANFADYRARYNLLALSFNKVPIPANIALFEKKDWLFTHYWADSESPMGQYYAFIPHSTWELDETSYEQGTILKTKLLYPNSDVWKMSDMMDQIEKMINSLLTSATFNYMYADIIRMNVKNGLPLYSMPLMEADYTLAPEYNPMILYMIHNATVLPNPFNEEAIGVYTPNNDVYPDVENLCLVYRPKFQINIKTAAFEFLQADNLMVDFPHSMGNPDAAQRIELTRLQASVEWGAVVDNVVTSLRANLPDTYVVYLEMWLGNGKDDGVIGGRNGLILGNPDVPDINNVNYIANMSRFGHAPLIYAEWITPNTHGVRTVNIIGDTDFYTLLDRQWYRETNDFAMMGLFAIR